MHLEGGHRSESTPFFNRWILALAMIFPTLGAWLYFVHMAGHPWAREVYLLAKIVQFSLPLVALKANQGLRIGFASLRDGAAWSWGVGSGALLLCLPLPLYAWSLRWGSLTQGIAERVAPKLYDFSITDFRSYLVFALLLSVVHSFLEEYYFRWFVFSGLRREFGSSVAILVSGLAFMAHHVIVIATYLGPEQWALTLLLSTGLALVGAFWAWLYQRTGTLLAPWLSHMLGDLAVMAIGYDLTRSLDLQG